MLFEWLTCQTRVSALCMRSHLLQQSNNLGACNHRIGGTLQLRDSTVFFNFYVTFLEYLRSK